MTMKNEEKRIAIRSDSLKTPLFEPCLTDKKTAYYGQNGQQDFLIVHLKKSRKTKKDNPRGREKKGKERSIAGNPRSLSLRGLMGVITAIPPMIRNIALSGINLKAKATSTPSQIE
jgi:hypothetical protein